MSKKAYTHMKQEEVNLAKRWKKEGKNPHEIAGLLARDPKTIREHLCSTKKKIGRTMSMKVGRPRMTESEYRKCEAALVALQKKSKGLEEVTAAMVKKKAKSKYCKKVIREAFAKRGKPFRKLREKPLLTEDDVKKRRAFAKKYCKKSARAWVNSPHAIIDNKKFNLYLDVKARCYAARRTVRGAYRTGGQAVESHLVKPKKTLKYPVSGVGVTAAIIKGKVRFWRVVQGRWNATQAVKMYGELYKALKQAYPRQKKILLLEDNDPSGYKSSSAVNKKAELGIDVLELPPRSPDLNALDYSIWAAISKVLREQEAKFPESKKETKEACLKRLRAAALGLPKAEVTKAVMGMRRRCRAIKDAKGYLIEG